MKSLTTLTPQQAGELLAFQRTSKQGVTTYLNPSDPAHRKFIESMLSAAGRTPANYPNIYKALQTGGAFKGSPNTDNVRLVDAGKTKAGKATATVWARSSNDTMIKGGNLLVFDKDSGALLAQGVNTAVKRGFLACPTRSATAAPAGKNLSVLYMGHTTEADGSTRFFSYANNAVVAQQGIQANVQDPVIKHTGNTDIMIAVGRVASITPPPPPNTDYIYVEPTQNEDNPYLIVPFRGNVGLSGLIDLPSLTIADLSTSVFVNNGHGSTVEITRATQYTTDAKMISAFSVGTPANILQWTFPFDGKGYQATQSIVYNPTSLANEVDSYFYFAFNGIPLQGGNTAPPFFVCSKDTPEEHSINCTTIPNLYFWWHCLAKGTLVTLEDGSKKPIEEINEKFRVKTDSGSLAVWATVLGRHSSNPAAGTRKEIFRLTTANGKSITATENHMVFMTADKCRSISHLVAGDSVMTDEGMSTVKNIEAIQHDGMFYALALGSVEEQASKNFPHNKANYYAGGVLCGDQQAMRHHCHEAHHDLEYMLPRIKQELHTDYASALQHKRF